MKNYISLFLIVLLFMARPAPAQDVNDLMEFDDIKSAKWVDGGIMGGYWDIEFKEKTYKAGNEGYNNVLQNYQQQNVRRRNSQVNEFRSGGIQVDSDPPAWARKPARTFSKQAKEQQRRQRNAQIERHNREIREYNQRIAEERAREEARREAARRAEREREQQLRYNAEYARAMANSATRFARQVDNAYQQRENIEILRNSKIDHSRSFSSGHSHTDEVVRMKPSTKTSISGIVSRKNRGIAVKGLESNAIPITQIKKDDHVPPFVIVNNRPEGDPLGNALYYAKKGVEAKTIGETMIYQKKSAWALSEAIGKNGLKNTMNPQIQAQVERAVLAGLADSQRKNRPIPSSIITDENRRKEAPIPQPVYIKQKSQKEQTPPNQQYEDLERQKQERLKTLRELQRLKQEQDNRKRTTQTTKS